MRNKDYIIGGNEMKSTDMIGLIIAIIIGLSVIVMALVLLTGRGSFLIAGYNTLSKEEKEKFNTKALCRFMGKVLLPIGLLIPILAINSIFYNIEWLSPVFTFGVFGLSVFAIIYCNTSNQFRK